MYTALGLYTICKVLLLYKTAYVYAAYAVRVTIFSTGSEFQPVSNFTECYTPTLAASSYALLLSHCVCMLV